MLDALVLPYTVGGTEVKISASLGVSVYPGDGSAPESLLKAADGALYRAKRAGKSRFEFSIGGEAAATTQGVSGP